MSGRYTGRLCSLNRQGKHFFFKKLFVFNTPIQFLLIFIVLAEANVKLKLGTGILIAVPIPREHQTSGHIIESAIQKALKEAR